MARIPFVCGNWKMFTTAASGRELAAAIAEGVADDRVRVAVCPPYPYLALIGEVLRGSRIALGAQNLYPANEGAFTGEVSPVMLKDVGCEYAIIGHSERRHVLNEPDAFINQKVKAVLATGLKVILCIGETLAERQSNKTHEVLRRQLIEGLKGVVPTDAPGVVVAYEPVWAIGTGHNATPEQSREAHAYVRSLYGEVMGEEAAARLTIQYGGSVKPENARSLLTQPDVDGALVGGASLKADSFLAIVQAARA